MLRSLAALLLGLGLYTPAQATSAHDWNGPYTGIALGFSDAQTTVIGNRFTYNQNQSVNRVDHDYKAAAIQAIAGWNRQIGAFVYGAEATLGFGDLSSNLVFNSDNDIDQVKIDWTGSLVGRLGYAFDRTLLYANAGVSFANIRNIGGDVNGGALTLSDAHMRNQITFGPTIGIGLSHAVSTDWVVRFEINQTDFAEYTKVNQDGVPGSQFYRVDNGPNRSISIGLLHKF